MFNLHASDPNVGLDSAGRPQEIRADGRRVEVTALEAIREEIAAYPAETGPRTVFVVRASQRRYRLVHLLRDRRWTVEELSEHSGGLTTAA